MSLLFDTVVFYRRKNKTRHKKIAEILTEAFNGKAPPFESASEDESENDTTSGTNDTGEEVI